MERDGVGNPEPVENQDALPVAATARNRPRGVLRPWIPCRTGRERSGPSGTRAAE